MLVLDVLTVLMLRSFDYNPIEKAMPVEARLPIYRQDNVNGRDLLFFLVDYIFADVLFIM